MVSLISATELSTLIVPSRKSRTVLEPLSSSRRQVLRFTLQTASLGDPLSAARRIACFLVASKTLHGTHQWYRIYGFWESWRSAGLTILLSLALAH
ncbi:hypothetical protein EJ03DRAFT_117418 [Teratosphaeria nubilosa]|uniref:Uncharacterized protein n=1 Tax=Teratosphaeria nubilosa TaxID=161662 RepID=A0A6G1L8G2_9PEZI|nr:hypothetical protein EJ03DRAFT_117418 [Teratosphaeria nubilosa]